MRGDRLSGLLLPTPPHNYRAINDRTPLLRSAHATAPARRKEQPAPIGNSAEHRRGTPRGFLCSVRPDSYSSFKEHVHQIDMLFPDWLHVKRGPAGAEWP